MPTQDNEQLAEDQLAIWLEGFGGARVLVVGDIMLDRYVSGEVRRISPEAPIPVLRAQARRRVLGGAGNVAQNVASLGALAALVGVVGDDPAATEIADMLAETPAIAGRLIPIAGRPTAVKTRFMAGGHQLLRLDEEVAEPIDAGTEDRVLAAIAEALPDVGVVVLSDYGKGVLTDRVLREVIAMARAAGTPVIADPKRADFTAYTGVDLLTPNALEVTQATGIATGDDDSAAAAGQAARAQAAAGAVLVTRSEKGMSLVWEGAAPLHVPTRARAVADVSGAGDTVVAALAVALAAGASLPQAAALANVAAGIAVGKLGTATVLRAELADALHSHAAHALDHKVVDRETAIERVAAWRRAGLKVGFTNGVFDLIHPGHVRSLALARAACDRLVVALNTDASVRRLKGPTRPVQTETARATVMAAMEAVDLVLLFGEDTPLEIITALLPDVLVKGADYKPEDVVGADVVQAHGGRLVLIPLEAGHSTTGTIQRIGGEK